MISPWSLLRTSGLTLLAFATVATSTPWVSAQVALDEQSLATSAKIRAVRYRVEPGQTRVWFETEGAVLYTHYSPDPLTLVIDLPGVDISEVAERTVVGSRQVESILATSLEGGNGKRLSRMELKLAAIVPYQLTGSDQALTVAFDGPVTASADDSNSPPIMASQSIETELLTPPVPDEAAQPVAMAPIPAEVPAPRAAEAIQPSYDTPAASAIRSLSHSVDDGVLSFDVSADGQLDYTSFQLDAPNRIVFDFAGVLNEVSRDALAIERMGVDRARIAQFRTSNPRITRLVFDMADDVYYEAEKQASGVRIAFSYAPPGATTASNFSSSPLAAMTPQAEAPVEMDAVEGDAIAEEDDAQSQSQTQATQVPIETTTDAEVVETQELMPPWAGPKSDSPESSAAVLTEDTAADSSVSVEPAAYEASPDDSVYQEDGIYIDNSGVTVASQDFGFSNPGPATPALPAPPPALTPPAPPQSDSVLDVANLGERQYTGELITLDFKDGDIQDIFRLFADISGLNIVVQPGVSGRITLKLTEVPWDQALELILKTNKLGYVVEGNVIRIAPLAELAQEEAERRRLDEEKALAGELFTQTRVLSYAKADELEPLLKRNLSARGDIVIDERTNTIIYTDLAEQIQGITTLIDTLDTPIPGVEIEARIVVTTRTFSRQLGVQWGFTGDLTQQQGNTTELVFPNRIQLGGQSIGNAEDNDNEFIVPGADSGGLLPPTSGGVRRGYAVNLPFAGTPTGAVGVSLGSITGAFSVDAALSAAERRGHVRIISAPKIITQNNKPAEIKQGVTFPVQVVANNTITVQFKDAVLQLQVTPQITSADTIILDIVVNNDSLDFGQQVQGIPSIVTQSATTQVLVNDGSTTVVGGVFVNRQQQDERFVPLLHKIPILGNLFKSKDAQSRNEELLIFLTPRIRKDT